MNTVTVEAITNILMDYSIEVTPKAYENKSINLREYLPEKTKIYITYLQGNALEKTLSTTKQIIDQGFIAVPHIVVRNYDTTEQLFDTLNVYQKYGVKDILLIAGGAAHQKGEIKDTLALLSADLWQEFHFRSIAFAGHPEGHPIILQEKINDALIQKKYFAKQISSQVLLVTQFGFLAQPMIDWSDDLISCGVKFPIRIGLAGLASLQSLMKHAQACGVGASISFLKNNRRLFTQLMKPIAPDMMITELAQAKSQQKLQQLQGLHFYPLGGLEKTVKWLSAASQGRISFNKYGGFDVTL